MTLLQISYDIDEREATGPYSCLLVVFGSDLVRFSSLPNDVLSTH